jgi:hypothetical protein
MTATAPSKRAMLWRPKRSKPPLGCIGGARTRPLDKRTIYSAGSTASTPFFFTMTTRNFAGFVALALRPTV